MRKVYKMREKHSTRKGSLSVFYIFKRSRDRVYTRQKKEYLGKWALVLRRMNSVRSTCKCQSNHAISYASHQWPIKTASLSRNTLKQLYRTSFRLQSQCVHTKNTEILNYCFNEVHCFITESPHKKNIFKLILG